MAGLMGNDKRQDYKETYGFGWLRGGAGAIDPAAATNAWAPQKSTGQSSEGFGWTPGTPSNAQAQGAQAMPQKEGSGMMQAMATAAPLVTGTMMAAGATAGISGALAGMSSFAGPGGIVIGGIIEGIASKVMKQAAPHASLRSSPLSDRGNYEDSVIYSSKLTNVGYSDTGSNHFKAGSNQQVLQALVQVDNALYDHFDEQAREAIQKNFSWQGNAADQGSIRNRYQMMLGTAAGASENAKIAQQTLKDAAYDYSKATKAIESFAIKDTNTDRIASLTEELNALRTTNDLGVKTPDELRIEKELSDIKDARSTQATPEQIGAIAQSAYDSYIKNGGMMSYDMFSATFANQLNGAATGNLISSKSPVIDALMKQFNGDEALVKKFLESKGQSISDVTPVNVLSDNDYFSLMIGGLHGYSYADIVSGAAQNGQHVDGNYSAGGGSSQQSAGQNTSNAYGGGWRASYKDPNKVVGGGWGGSSGWAQQFSALRQGLKG